jgi:hypothetical protein
MRLLHASLLLTLLFSRSLSALGVAGAPAQQRMAVTLALLGEFTLRALLTWAVWKGERWAWWLAAVVAFVTVTFAGMLLVTGGMAVGGPAQMAAVAAQGLANLGVLVGLVWVRLGGAGRR